MPNEDIDWTRLDSLEKYRSYTRYVRAAEEADRRDVWWKTYRKYREEEKNAGKSSLMDQSFRPCYSISVGQRVLIVFVGSR